ncbi:hypothetical protein SO802_015786 [Lithocarpus litseifolius]|uniref:No apical meristem-associated C-terminal domain-containing protein n=1 Tax=Lithocarpus litseifolius TaxID=425828 RepID=A0AAW2CYS6_9ROSI
MATVENRDVEIRSSELEMGLSSNAESIGKEVDTAVSKPSSSSLSIPLHALTESCSLKGKLLKTFRKRFQFSSGTVVRFLVLVKKLVLLLTMKYNKDKYARIKGMKNEPLSQLTADPKRRKLNKGKDNPKVESIEAENSKLRKYLIEVMNEANNAKAKVKELNEELKVEKMLVAQKDEEIYTALLKTNSEHEKIIQKFMKSEHFSNHFI